MSNTPASLRYRNPPIPTTTHWCLASRKVVKRQTHLAALRETKRKGHRTLAICNVVASSIAQAADGGVYLHAGPEIGVASTKAYTSQCCVLGHAGTVLRSNCVIMSFERGKRNHRRTSQDCLPQSKQALTCDEQVREVATKVSKRFSNVLYLGRQFNFPTALGGGIEAKRD